MSVKLEIFKTSEIYNKDTFPFEYKVKHSVSATEFENPVVLLGELKYIELDDENNILREEVLKPGEFNFIVNPNTQHRYEVLTDDTMMQFNYLCVPSIYFNKKYDLKTTHTDVIEAVSKYGISPGKTLDLGSGSGRNAFYLSLLGHEITAVDKNPLTIDKIKQYSKDEALDINAFEYDINEAAIKSNYDFIMSTVTFMFLNPDKISEVIKNMQEHTNHGGYNLIVSAMSTKEHPTPIDFPFTFSEGELSDYYSGWELVKYNENLGHLHRKDKNGNPYQLQFATMLAKKPEIIE